MVDYNEHKLVFEALLHKERVVQVSRGHIEEVSESLASHSPEDQPLQSHLLGLVYRAADVADSDCLKSSAEQRLTQVLRGLQVSV